MKTRLNITIEETLLKRVKSYAIKKQISVSGLIENYLETVVRISPKRTNLLDMIDKLEPNQKIVTESNEKASFYESQKEKYGF